MSGDYKIPIGPLIATIGALIVIVSLFVDWYDGLTGWTVFEIDDLVLVGLGLWTIFAVAGGFGVAKGGFNPAGALIASIVALVIVVTQIVNDPPAVAGGGGPTKEIGIWLALGGAALMVAGAVLAMTHISLAVEARRRDTEPAESNDEPTVPLTGREPPERQAGDSERP